MTDAIKQEDINAAVWAVCNTFRGTVDASIYKDYVLTMLFVKYISDVWRDHYRKYQEEYGDEPKLIQEMMKTERFTLPEGADFYSLYDERFQPGNGERIDKALHAVEEANIGKLRDVFQDISFNSTRLGEDLSTRNQVMKFVIPLVGQVRS